MVLSEEERRQAAAEQIPLPKPFRLTKTPWRAGDNLGSALTTDKRRNVYHSWSAAA